jgi:hypothetical protein
MEVTLWTQNFKFLLKIQNFQRKLQSNLLHGKICRTKLSENGRIHTVKFRPKICGRFFFYLGEFRPMYSQKFADLGEIRPNQQNFARKLKFWLPASFEPT